MTVPVEQVVRKVEHLQSKHRWNKQDIALRTGIPRRTISRWTSGKVRTVHLSIANKLFLAESVDAPRYFLPAVGCQRRLQALVYRGFSAYNLGLRGVVGSRNIYHIISGESRWVTQGTVDQVKSLFWDVLTSEDPVGPGADRVREAAREAGYLPYGVWGDIDDPECVPESQYDVEKTPLENDPDLLDAVLRVRALAIRGFTVADTLDLAGVNRSNGFKIVAGTRGADTDTVKKLHRACDELEPLPDPTGPFAEKTKTLSRRKGWD